MLSLNDFKAAISTMLGSNRLDDQMEMLFYKVGIKHSVTLICFILLYLKTQIDTKLGDSFQSVSGLHSGL